MATLQQYFNYVIRGGCGFPSVTLLGEVADWQKILQRVDRLPRYGKECAEWADLLRPVLNRMIGTFYLPNSEELKDFWMRICHRTGQDGSGDLETYSGWITAFSYWDEHGSRLGLSYQEDRTLKLDGVAYPVIRPKFLADGVVKVPVTVEDYATSLKHTCTLIAGSVGMTIIEGRGATTVQPRSGWWMLEDSVEAL